MPAILLSALLLCATTLAWAQHGPSSATDRSPDHEAVLAEIEAASAPGAHWELLGTLADAAAQPDRSVAAPAAGAASRLAHEFDAFDMDELEIPRAEFKAIQLRWLHIATDTERWVDIRIYALDVAAQIHAVLLEHGEPVGDSLWRAFLEDPDPQMRSAALTLVPSASDLASVAVDLLANDNSEEVALAAGQRICGPLGRVPTTITPLGLRALGRLQVLASNRELPIVPRSNLAPCLVAEGSIESRRALGLLLQKSPPALRRTLQELIRAPKAPIAP